MPAFPSGRHAALLAAGVLTAGSLYLAGGAAADTVTTSYSSSCFAQLVSLQLGGNDVPLDEGRDCTDPGDSFFPTDTIAGPADFPFVVNVLYENTSRSADQSSARARAGVAHVFLPFSAFGGPDVTVDVLTSESTCSNGTASGSSHVVGVDIGGQGGELPGDITGDTIDLGPLGVIELNQQETSASSSDTGAGSNPRVQTATNNLRQTALHVVLLPADPDPPALDLVVARTSVSCTKTTTTTVTNPPPPPPPSGAVGWMSGGGQLANGVTHSLVLPCTTSQKHPKPKLQVETPTGTFRLDTLDPGVACSYDKNQGSPEQPDAGFNTLSGTGKGTCNGISNVPVSFRFTDEGEPNKGADEANTTIPHAACRVQADGTVNGNQQAHRSNNPPA
jgi:hypothetical protein